MTSLYTLIVHLLLLLRLAEASVHFYLEPQQSQCFLKQLPRDSILLVQYKIEASKDDGETYQEDSETNLNIQFTVEETFDSNHKVANQRGEKGQFIFTALDTGEHKICLSPVTAGGYQLPAKSRITIDLNTGDKDLLETPDTERLTSDLHLRQLYKKMNGIMAEYLTFRGREAQFRDLSESVNGSAVRWVVIQVVVLAIICYVQLGSLKRFFIKEKVL
ncbi:DEKNAAC102858 [Brettanomyces naardenensis]|uniref:DEKNAAC102858 n=1 Tax=Brettanomyces naardenensis TaxID=13370 RepID=A0A448YLX9_BRENA|nr:DEKNAAC102858 [Brettanomyces naardenensis]